MGLDAITVRQKQIAGSLARARRYGGASVRESELTKDVTNRLLAPTVKRLAAHGAADDAEPRRLIRRRLIAAGLATATPDALPRDQGHRPGLIFLRDLLSPRRPAPVHGLIFGIVGGALAFLLPDFVVAAWCAHAARTC